jgi:hypothetical protein
VNDTARLADQTAISDTWNSLTVMTFY